MLAVLVLASGASWEGPALAHLDSTIGVVVLRRCMDADDLVAAAASGQADAALVDLTAPGFDPLAVESVHRHGVRVVAVLPAGNESDGRERARLLGVDDLVPESDPAGMVSAVRRGDGPDGTRMRAEAASLLWDPDGVAGVLDEEEPAPAVAGRVVAVWGPAGAPGRTTLAVGIADALAARGAPCLLVDADPYGGAVAQHLGILDEVSGLLQVARLAASGQLPQQIVGAARTVAPNLAVLTGLPRADRWPEVRPAHVEEALQLARARGHVVVDVGFSIEEDQAGEFGTRPGRNSTTLAALGAADEIIVVGAADPVGLARLARALVELGTLELGAPVRVVVNRMRQSLGWSQTEVAGMVEGFTRAAALHFVPEDRDGADRALLTGEPMTRHGSAQVRAGLAAIVDATFPEAAQAPGNARRIKRRRAGTGRRR